MIDDARRIEDLVYAVKRARAEARKVSLRLFAASFVPRSNARSGLKARHAALVKISDESEAEIERLRRGQHRQKMEPPKSLPVT